MNNQEILDKVATHLLTQNKKAYNHGNCLYRGPDNTKCAVGCLIPDDKYDIGIEGFGIVHPTIWPTLEEIGIKEESQALLGQLQNLHDSYEPDLWRSLLVDLANKFELKVNF